MKIPIRSYFIFDGDTLNCTSSLGEQFKTRAAWIDAPEIGHGEAPPNAIASNQWAWGQTSKDYLRSLLSGKHLLITPIGTDQYDRRLAFWFASATLPVRTSLASCIQVQMIAAGMAVDFFPYQNLERLSNSEVTLFCRILREQQKAHRNRRGFWADPDFIRPSEYRRSQI